MELSDILIKAYSLSCSEFSFEIGDKVRIKSTLQHDTWAIQDMLGKEGIVICRKHVGFLRECCYDVKIGNRTEPFRDNELDSRYRKKSRNYK
jgi:hypothetical protein